MVSDEQRTRLRQQISSAVASMPLEDVEKLATALDEFLFRDVEVRMRIPAAQLGDDCEHHLLSLARKTGSLTTFESVIVQGDFAEALAHHANMAHRAGMQLTLLFQRELSKAQADILRKSL